MRDLADEFARATRRKRTIGIALVIAACSAPFVWVIWSSIAQRMRDDVAREERRKELMLDEDDKAIFRETLPQLKEAFASAREAWLRDVTPEKLATVVPGESRCPRRFETPTATAADSYRKYGSIDSNYFGDLNYVQYTTGDAMAPRDLDGREYDRAELQRAFDAGEATKVHLGRLSRLAGDAEVLFLVSTRRPAIATAAGGSTGSYMPGSVVGMAYLYSYVQGGIVCAGVIEAQNGSSVETEYRYMEGNFLDEDNKATAALRGALDRDLDVQVRLQIASRMRAL